jgi:hypothetical protein
MLGLSLTADLDESVADGQDGLEADDQSPRKPVSLVRVSRSGDRMFQTR